MADPTPYVPAYSYSGWQQNNPTRPLPAGPIDNDFASLRRTTSELIQALREVRRSDGALNNGMVTADSLAPQLSLGFGFEGAWAAGTAYQTGGGVVYENAFYRADSQHTAAADAPPGDGGPWTFLFSIDDIVVAGALAMPVDTFTGDGSTAGFNLSFTPRSANNLIVSVGGVVQAVTEYSVNGNTITFDDPPEAGYAIEIRGFATTATVVEPADGSVTETKLDGALADKINSALQPDDIGATVQAQSSILDNLADGSTPILAPGDVSLIVETTSEATLEAAITQAATDIRAVTFVGTVQTNGSTLPGTLKSIRPNTAVLERTTGTSAGIALTSDGASLENITIDNKASVGPRPGHGIRTVVDDAYIRNVVVRDFGSMDGIGGGTGILVLDDGGGRPQRPRITDAYLLGNTASQITIGWILESSDFGFVSHVLAENIVGSAAIGYAHELKNDSSFNNMHALTAKFAESGFSYGGEVLGVGNGSKYNVLTGLIASAVDKGIDSAWSVGNVIAGAVIDADGRPESITESYAVELSQTIQNAYFGIGAFGTGVNARSVLIDGASEDNFVQVAAHAEGTITVRLNDTADNNVVEIVHPGNRTSILGTILDTSTGGNVVYSPATGEQLGTLSGTYYEATGSFGVTWNSSHIWRREAQNTAIETFGTDGTAGNTIGLGVAIPGDGNRGGFWHILGATAADDVWVWRGQNIGEILRLNSTAFRPTRDADDASSRFRDLGESIARWRRAYAKEFRPGAGAVIWTSGVGTPEGVVTAPVGSLYTNTSGGAGSTLYVKQTGTGNTGWAAK